MRSVEFSLLALFIMILVPSCVLGESGCMKSKINKKSFKI